VVQAVVPAARHVGLADIAAGAGPFFLALRLQARKNF